MLNLSSSARAALCVSIWAGLAAPFAHGAAIDQIVVFGDSLSDTGNILSLSTSPLGMGLGFTPRPIAPFYRTGQFTNGPGANAGLPETGFTAGVWHNTLADRLGVPRAAASGVDPLSPVGTNFAFGGATVTVGSPFLPSIPQQLDRYVAGRTQVPNSPLHVFWGGANDLIGTAGNDGVTEADVNLAGAAALNTLRGSILGLIGRMDQSQPMRVLWANLPSLDRVPLAQALTPVARAGLASATAAFAAGQQQVIAELEAQFPTLELHRLDVYGLFNSVLDQPLAFGLADVTTPVLINTNFTQPGPFVPQRIVPDGVSPDLFAFWDSLHPTARVHALLGEAAARAVPTPGAAAVLLLAGLAAAHRRR